MLKKPRCGGGVVVFRGGQIRCVLALLSGFHQSCGVDIKGCQDTSNVKQFIFTKKKK